MAVTSLHHVVIRVQDPDRSREFYGKVLGFAFLELPVGTERDEPVAWLAARGDAARDPGR